MHRLGSFCTPPPTIDKRTVDVFLGKGNVQGWNHITLTLKPKPPVTGMAVAMFNRMTHEPQPRSAALGFKVPLS